MDRTKALTLKVRWWLRALLVLWATGCSSPPAAAPPRILAPARAPAPVESAADALHRRDAQLAEQLGTVFARLAEHGFAGVILVARGDEVVFARGYGLADREAGVRWTAETPFGVASLTKSMTAAAVLKLCQQGRLELSTTLGELFPNRLTIHQAALPIHQLVNHTSGLSDELSAYHDVKSPEEFWQRVAKHRFSALPGERFLYSNIGYSLLAAVIDARGGKPYEQYLRDEILRPAGVHATLSRPASGAAAGYIGPPSAERRAPSPTWYLRGSADAWASAQDLHRWQRQLAAGKVLSAATTKQLFEPGLGHYALGWWVDLSTSHGKQIYHGGTLPGAQSHVVSYPDSGWVVVAAVNTRRGWLEVAIDQVEAVLFGEPKPLPAPAERWSDEQRAQLVGSYRLGSAQLEVLERGDQLFIAADGDEAFEVLVEPAEGEGPKRGSELAIRPASTATADYGSRARTLIEALEGQRPQAVQRLISKGAAPGAAARLMRDHRTDITEIAAKPGEPATLRVLGTLSRGKGLSQTYIALDGSLGTDYRRLLWDAEGKLAWMIPSEPLEPMVRLIPSSADTLQLLVFHSGEVGTIRLQRAAHGITALRIDLTGRTGRTLIAERVTTGQELRPRHALVSPSAGRSRLSGR